jgi:hypothetical protein
VAQGAGPEFKPTVQPKKKNNFSKIISDHALPLLTTFQHSHCQKTKAQDPFLILTFPYSLALVPITLTLHFASSI